MKTKLKYTPDLDALTDAELILLDKACAAVESFVSQRYSKLNLRTRDAHATTYSSLKGTFQAYDSFEEHHIFQEKKLNCLIRISNAHMKIVSQKKTIPAYGFSVKLSDEEKTIANFPLVNFPLFPINHVARFLKIFAAVNRFFPGNIFQKIWQFTRIVKNLFTVLPGFFNPSFVWESLRFIKKYRRFILSFDYHSIGVYRLGDHMVKLKLVPLGISTEDKSQRIDNSIKNYVETNGYELELQAQYCYNLQDQPVNKLNQQWRNSEFFPVGKINIAEVIDKDDRDVEQMSFDPFENISGLQPVGRIQKLRKKAYYTSFKTRKDN